MMKSTVIWLLATAIVISAPTAQAQQPAKIPRVGILLAPSASFNSSRVEALRQRLRELGYVEGTSIVVEYRYAEGKLELAGGISGSGMAGNPKVFVLFHAVLKAVAYMRARRSQSRG